MIHTPKWSTRSGRRIFTFPAVHPWESIPLFTLLNSLIDLVRESCSYSSKFFSANKRNAREAFRQIGNLLVFLEEIRNLPSTELSGSIVSSLSDLHLTFQKLNYLLEDCTSDGTRLWMLIKSDLVCSELRVLIQSIATNLDGFPFELVELTGEVTELVELVMRQARKARFEVEEDDKRVVDYVNQILSQFEEGIVPDGNGVKQVLNHIGIRKWSECSNEVKFLDAEISLGYLKFESRRELSYLNSLMAFMCYCRSVIFDSLDDEANENGYQERNNSKSNSNSNSCDILHGLNPDDFLCPISLEIMKDPVTVSSGHTYDRSSILKWFKSGNLICPNTGEKLTSTDLFPNLVLKHLIQQYCTANGSQPTNSHNHHKNLDMKKALQAASSAAVGAIKMVAMHIRRSLANGESTEIINKTVLEVRVLTETSHLNRSYLVQAGIVQNLLNLLLTTKDSTTQENSIAGLLNFSKHNEGKRLIAENVDPIVGVLIQGEKVESKQHAAGILFYLASVEKYSKLIGEIPEAIPGLVDLIKCDHFRARKKAMVAILGLLMHIDNQWRVLASGIVPLLVTLLKSTNQTEELVTHSLAILATLAETPEGSIAIIMRGALKLAMGLLDSSASRVGKEYCVSLLLALCLNCGRVVVAYLVKSPSLMQSLYSLLSQGSNKAGSLINILHRHCEVNTSTSPDHVLSRELFI